jgi:hypothetical protein
MARRERYNVPSFIRRGVEQWQLVRPITWRSLVRVQPPQLIKRRPARRLFILKTRVSRGIPMKPGIRRQGPDSGIRKGQRTSAILVDVWQRGGSGIACLSCLQLCDDRKANRAGCAPAAKRHSRFSSVDQASRIPNRLPKIMAIPETSAEKGLNRTPTTSMK